MPTRETASGPLQRPTPTGLGKARDHPKQAPRRSAIAPTLPRSHVLCFDRETADGLSRARPFAWQQQCVCVYPRPAARLRPIFQGCR
jgi:hypothetical protein